MEELEKYIIENRKKFNMGEMPEGHKERFLNKIASAESQEVRDIKSLHDNKKSHSLFLKIALPIAAVLVIGASILFFHKFNSLSC